MTCLRVKRFIQDPCYCAIASCAVIANHYNSYITYDITKKIADKKWHVKNEGIETSQIGVLLNSLGFKKITIVSNDLVVFDFSWKDLSRKNMVRKLLDFAKKNPGYDEVVENYRKFLLNRKSINKIVIDYDYGPYIRENLDAGRPILFSFNWTMYFRFSKACDHNKFDPLQGEPEIHAVVIYGYDDEGVRIVDSHSEYYKYSRQKYSTGRYKMKWEHLMNVVTDIVIPSQYSGDDNVV